MKKITVILLLGFIGCTPMVIKNYSISYMPRAVLVTDYASTSSNLQGIVYYAGYLVDNYDSMGLALCKLKCTDTNFVKTGYGTISDQHGYFKIDYLPAGTYHFVFSPSGGPSFMVERIRIYSDSIAFIRLNLLKDHVKKKAIVQWD